MFKIMIQKLWHKKWMVACLLLGSILLVATVVSYPMYKNAVYNRMLQDEFTNYMVANSEWPIKYEMTTVSKKDKGGATMKAMEKLYEELDDKLGLSEYERQIYYYLKGSEAKSMMNRSDATKMELKIAFMSNIENHIAILSGEIFSEDGLTEDGYVEAIISQETMVQKKLLVGEVIDFKYTETPNGNKVKAKIVGVFGSSDKTDFYWATKPDELTNVLIIKEDLFRDYFTGDRAEKFTITNKYVMLYNYSELLAENVKEFSDTTEYLTQKSNYKSVMKTPAYTEILDSYTKKQTRIESTLFILQVPVLLLLCAFLLMLSGQMYEMEKNEISILKSRGSSGGQIFRLYLYQSISLSAIGTVLGLPLGAVFCKVLGSADNFLEFGITRELVIAYKKDVFIYAGIAAAVSVLIMTIPSIKHSKLSIVKLKQSNAVRKKSLWEKLFLDVIFLGVSIYGFYNFSNSKATLVKRVLEGKALDPLLYVSSTLFILGLGMLFLRLQPLIVKLIYVVRKNRWKPANYASFLEIQKNGRKQQFIMLFMILTVSLGMFNAVVARTILQNALKNKEYIDGTELRVKEIWLDNSKFVSMDPTIELTYYEPEYSKYEDLEDAERYTKVIIDDTAQALINSVKRENITVMAIQTKEFGQNTSLDDSILEKPYYEYLNEMAVRADAILVSNNLKNQYGLKIGDKIYLLNKDGKSTQGTIVDFIDYWPSYSGKSISLNEENEVVESTNYLVIAHFANVWNKWGATPYEVWISTKAGASSNYIYNWINNNSLEVSKFVDRERDLQDVIEDPLLQGTNGVLTMSFIVTIILCAIGYLIYWIMSIRDREMMFGVLRAFGMHKNEVLQILTVEQIFSGIYAILVGAGIGTIASQMFVPMLQTAYAASDQVLPMTLITNQNDIIRLYLVVAAVMAVCLIVLATIVFKLNVAKALKLGEE